jgi:monoamine oxidase
MITRRAVLAGGGAAIIAGAAPRPAWGQTSADVVVIGAGLAGLHAAALLEAAGLRVTVVEGRDRVGGRLHTRDDLPGRPEAGGVQVGSNYGLLEAIAQARGIALLAAPPPPADRRALYAIAGRLLSAEQYAATPPDRLNPRERALPPDALLRSYLGAMPQHASPAAWASGDGDASLADAVRAQGASDDALRLMNANLNATSLAATSTVHFLRQNAIYRAGAGPIRTIAGGSQRLPEAMAAALRGDVRLREPVTGIAEAAEGVAVRLAGGRVLRARHVICTIPFPALRTLPMEAELPASFASLIVALPYTRVSQIHLLAPADAAADFPEILWSDDPALGRVLRGPTVQGQLQLKAWFTGAFVDRIDRTSGQEAGRAVVARLEALLPALRGRLRVTGYTSWQADPFARGAYHHIGVGQARALAAAVRHRGRRLHFAGEHLALEGNGMEGALESGGRAAEAVLAAR